MRYVGIGLMAVAAIGTGFWAGERWSERLKILQMLRQMVYHLKSQILYANESLPEALREVGGRFSGTKSGRFSGSGECTDRNTGSGECAGRITGPGECFLRIAERAGENRDQPFSIIWKEEVLKFAETCPLSAADRENLVALGEQLGLADRDMQERTLMFYLEETDDAIAYLKKEVDDRRKLYRSLGVAAGLFFVVFLI